MIKILWSKLSFFISTLHKRWWRLILHLLYPILFKTRYTNYIKPIGILGWFYSLFFYLLDVSGIPEFIEIVFSLTKWKIRQLSPEERELTASVFGKAIELDHITIDRNCRIGMKYADAYVTFNTINYRGELSSPIFIHEMVHIWQYQRFGSIYIPHAIHAQFNDGYDYGGAHELYHAMLAGRQLISFNFEQQAEIIEDMYRRQIYGYADRDHLGNHVYAYFYNHLTEYA